MGNKSSAQASRTVHQPFPDGRVTVDSFEQVDGDDGRMCLAIETRTTAKDSHDIAEQRFLFDASLGRRFSVGASASSDVVVTDPNVQAEQAFLEVLPGGVIRFVAAARSYQMLSAPDALGNPGLELSEGQVIKMGACSVQVMAIQLPKTEKDEDKDPDIVSESSSCRSDPHAAAAAAGDTGDLTHSEQPQTRVSPEVRSSPSPTPAATRYDGGDISDGRCSTPDDTAMGEAGDDDMSCFICMCGSSAETPLMPSPCKCRANVHRSCLKRWVESKGSRSCSICKAKLPFSATVDPPYLVFQVIRHMRGLHWNGEREYILSFFERAATAGRARVVVGSHTSCGIRLPDPSMSKQHAEVSYDAEARTFHLSDLKSRAGTFIKVVEPVLTRAGQLARFKFARTTLSFELATLADIKAMAAARRIAEPPPPIIIGRQSSATPGAHPEHAEPTLQARASQHSIQGEDSAQPSAAASPMHSDH